MIIFPSPQTKTWTQPNTSDLFGSLWSVRGINLDRPGYLELSNASVGIDGSTSIGFALNANSTGASQSNSAYILTSAGLTGTKSLHVNSDPVVHPRFSQITALNNPQTSIHSDSVNWQDRWYVSTDISVHYLSSGTTWNTTPILLTNGFSHPIEVFKNKNTICIGDNKKVRQYDATHVTTVDLVLQEDVQDIVYNNYQMGVLTKNTDGQGQSYFYIWDGSTAQANGGYPLGASGVYGICAYQSTSWAILSSQGQLLKFNGSGFTVLAEFPFTSDNRYDWFGTSNNNGNTGSSIYSIGDIIYINVNSKLSTFKNKDNGYIETFPCGIWCYNPKVGLYHKFNKTNNKELRSERIIPANVNTGTGIITLSSTSIPITGTPVRYMTASGLPIGGLFNNKLYYTIKISSTTLKLATSKTNALNGVSITLTSQGSVNQSFIFYSPISTAVLQSDIDSNSNIGFIKPFNGNPLTEIIFSNFTAFTGNLMCSITPDLENYGSIITPRIYSSNFKDIWKKINIKYSGVTKDIDLIRVKYRDEEYPNIPGGEGLPQGNSYLFPTSTTSLSTSNFITTNDSKDPLYKDLIMYLTNGVSDSTYTYTAGDSKEIEITITGGASAGHTSRVTGIVNFSGAYQITLETPLNGSTAGNISANFAIWKTIGDITYTDTDGYKELPIETVSKFIQFKLELRGYGVVIEEIQIINEPHTLSS